VKEGLRSVVTTQHHAGYDLVMTVVGEPEVIRSLAAELVGDGSPAGPSVAELDATPPGSIVHTSAGMVDAQQYEKVRYGKPGEPCWRTHTADGRPVETTSSLLARMGVRWGPIESGQESSP
jgi:hypothetical protein